MSSAWAGFLGVIAVFVGPKTRSVRKLVRAEERRPLAEAALAMGSKAMRAVVSIVKPDTILRWHRRLMQAKWDYSQRRRRGPGHPRKPGEVEELA